MMHVPTPVDQKLALALVESDARLDQERRETEASEDEQLEKIGKRIDRCKAQGVAVILEIGKQLNAAHDRFAGAGRDGEFGPWVKRRCYFSLRTAYRYRDVHRRFAGQKCATVAHFEQRALYCLAKEDCPQEAVDKAIEMADRGERITLHAAKSLVKDHVEAVAAADTTPPADTIAVVAESPRAIEDHFGSDATVTAGGSSDEDPPAESGVEIEQLQDAFDTHVLPRLAKASPAVRKKFLAWVAKT
jgi:hypothetical protein